jgi:hypothetical protein
MAVTPFADLMRHVQASPAPNNNNNNARNSAHARAEEQKSFAPEKSRGVPTRVMRFFKDLAATSDSSIRWITTSIDAGDALNAGDPFEYMAPTVYRAARQVMHEMFPKQRLDALLEEWEVAELKNDFTHDKVREDMLRRIATIIKIKTNNKFHKGHRSAREFQNWVFLETALRSVGRSSLD